MSATNMQTSAGQRAVGRPVAVLLHSSAASARQWDALAASLTHDFEVHAVDLYGHGTQPEWRGDAPLTFADEAARLLPLIDARDGVHLIGHSYGGAVALQVAALRPHKVRSLAVYEPVWHRLLIDRGEGGELSAVGASVRGHLSTGDAPGAARCFIDFWSDPGSWARLPAERKASFVRRIGTVALHFHAIAATPWPAEALARIGAPMLCLCGSQTVHSTRRIAALLRTLLPEALHETIAGAGHMGPVTHGAQVNERFSRFLRAAAVRPGGSAPHTLIEPLIAV